MKKILLPFMGIAIFAFSFTAKANDGKKSLPGPVSSSITAKYHDARIRGWSMQNNDYVVNIMSDNGKCTAWFTRDGSWVKTIKHLALSKDLPEPVRSGLNKSGYAGWHFDSIREIASPDATKYVLHVDNGNTLSSDNAPALQQDYYIYFDANGNLINKVPWTKEKSKSLK